MTPRTAASQVFLSFTISRSLLKLMSIESVMLSNHLILCHSLLLLPSIFPSIRVFSNELTLHIRWPKDSNFSISSSSEYSGFISLEIDWFGLLAVQGTLKSLLKHHSSTASILRSSAFFTAQEEPPLCRRLFLSSSLGTLAHPLAQIFLQGSLPLRTAQS